MLFPTFEFLAFFTFVLILNWTLKRWSLIWRLFLLIASYFFYSVWDLRFLLVLFIVSLVNFIFGLLIHKNFLKQKKFFLSLSIIFNILILIIFKYYDFFRVSAESLLEKIGLYNTFPLLEIILPLGLSFYIFRVISYSADIYSGKITATFSILDFLIYVAFFPQLLAGPISRAGDFLPQLKNGGAKTIENLYLNITLIILGLFKKLVISSYLVLNLTDNVFAVPENHSSLVILLAILAYTLVIYFDFSAYSDLSIGFAGLLGFKSPVNFDSPYLAQSLIDFWRRWHISFSSWLRDYVYIPLGGNRKGNNRKYLNLMVTMLIAGLWHGAALHFVFWGFLYGIGLIISHFYRDRQAMTFNFQRSEKRINKFFSWLFTFIFVSFCWIFFRSGSIKDAITLIKNLFVSSIAIEPIQVYVILSIILGFFIFTFEKQIIKYFSDFQRKLSVFSWISVIIFIIIIILKLSPETVPPFIYFGF
jgi:D-alanyl-lipoteichoic acid acyltransferase DltB (MBOAT superfamily)